MDTKSSSTRKRSRPVHQRLNNSSPLSDNSSLSSAKRRKIDTDISSHSTPKALQILKSAIGGVFGSLTKSKGTAADYSDRPDELGNDRAQSPVFKRNKKKVRSSDIATHDNDESNIALTTLSQMAQQEKINASHASKRHVGKGDPRSTKPSTPNVLETGRPKLLDAALEKGPSSSGAARSSGRERKRPRRYSTETVEETKKPSKGIMTPSKRRHTNPRKSVAFESDGSIERDSRVDIQSTLDIDNISEQSPIPKRKRGRPRKVTGSSVPAVEAVAIDWDRPKVKKSSADDENIRTSELDTEYRLSKKPKSPSGQQEYVRKPLWPEDDVKSDEDDTRCIICNGGESKYPNEILLCDSCDLAAHQVCYSVSIIPEGDWLCRDCRPDEDEELSLLETGTLSEPTLGISTSNAPEIEGVEYHLQVMQKLVLDKLTGRRQFKLYDLDEEYQKVHQIVEQTVVAGEGNSMLVIGARGCGKTTLVESVLSDISKDHRQDFHVVRLNGFIHTDDKLALREIWRQLGREMEVEDEVISKTNNYADTLASLLALLSHPSEISGVEADHIAKAVIFILDEFDLFASHPRQTLLYNLFDIAQARKAPLAVLGITTKIDVVERLEKRVKSRFSHRYVHLPLPRSLAAYWEICRQGLLADKNELVEEGFNQGLSGQDEFLSYWESMINDLYHKDFSFKRHLQLLYYRSKSVPSFLTTCILPIASLTSSSLPLTGSSFIPSGDSISIPSLQPPDSKLHLLPSLAGVDLALLIAAARLNIILDTENCNFAMAYDEYCSLTSKHKIQTASSGIAALGTATKVWGREVALCAWERLIQYELLIPAGVGTMAGARDTTGREVKMWRVDVGLEEIPGSVELVGVMGKWCREI